MASKFLIVGSEIAGSNSTNYDQNHNNHNNQNNMLSIQRIFSMHLSINIIVRRKDIKSPDRHNQVMP